MNAHVTADNLKVYFQSRSGLFRSIDVKAVDDVSIEIPRGTTLALVGESGSGKTTLGRALLKLLELKAGRILIDDLDISTLRRSAAKKFRRKAQAIFQDPYSSISPYMTVGEIIEEPLLIHGIGGRKERSDAITRAIEMVKLSPAAEIRGKFPHNLSGGQRQRVSIARAMVLDPEFVVADEPVSMVDASNRAEILLLLRELQEGRNISFLYITHDIANARHFSDRIGVMYLGTIVEEGGSSEVIDRPLHPYTLGLIAAVPEPDPANRKKLRAVMSGELPNAARVPPGCPFHPRCTKMIPGTCDVERPEMRDNQGDHRVACHLY
ncbi:MAG: ABC transporter ATP-binding protein [Spirochaetales bacterium]|jgi:peptide/nickel transport system ATP-binding protein|nr:ABC transporter ATP-binding protein [Spirochaetales bacterium]